MKPKRIVNKDLLAEIRKKPCAACGKGPVDAAHIRSRGAGGPDEEWNVIALCRKHHTLQHSKGWISFLMSHPPVLALLRSLGWEIDMMKLWHRGLS